VEIGTREDRDRWKREGVEDGRGAEKVRKREGERERGGERGGEGGGERERERERESILCNKPDDCSGRRPEGGGGKK
jgi:hypothetical protein